ncbi:LOW QUALITY PROTEIN: zinc finger protein 770 [Rhynochetos jubatus]
MLFRSLVDESPPKEERGNVAPEDAAQKASAEPRRRQEVVFARTEIKPGGAFPAPPLGPRAQPGASERRKAGLDCAWERRAPGRVSRRPGFSLPSGGKRLGGSNPRRGEEGGGVVDVFLGFPLRPGPAGRPFPRPAVSNAAGSAAVPGRWAHHDCSAARRGRAPRHRRVPGAGAGQRAGRAAVGVGGRPWAGPARPQREGRFRCGKAARILRLLPVCFLPRLQFLVKYVAPSQQTSLGSAGETAGARPARGLAAALAASFPSGAGGRHLSRGVLETSETNSRQGVIAAYKVHRCVTADGIAKKKPYICDICYKQFETPSKLARHYLIHTGQKPFECHVCHKTFRQLVHLERHQLTHNLPFKCIVCHRNFKNLIAFVKHQQLHNVNCQSDTQQTENSVNSEQECSLCWTSFTKEERWMLHQCLKADHLQGARRRKKTHACESCNKAFPSRSKLERHFLIHTGQKPFKCSSCGKSFRQSTHLKIHQLTHTEERPFQCCFCQKGFKISKLMKHKQLHSRNKTFPNILYKAKTLIYPRPQNLLEGRRDSVENAESQENDPHDVGSVYNVPFQCLACEQCFETQQVLNLHKCYLSDGKSSNNGTPACSHTVSMKNKILMKLKCTGGKATDFSLTDRKKKKSGHFKSPDPVAARDQCSDQNASTKPFKDCHSKPNIHKALSNRMKRTFAVPLPWQEHCQPCDFGMNLKGMLTGESMLNSDDSLHNKDAAFYGSSDDAFFDNPEVLHHTFSASAKNIHNRHKVCKCDRCEKIFQSSSKLQRHYLIHTGQKPFGCSVCGKTFRQSAHLKRHQLTHTEKRPYKSPVCQVEFENLNKLFSHRGDHIEFKSSQPVGYSGYSQTFSQASGFQEFELIELNQAAEIKVEIESGDFVLDTSSRNTQSYLCSKLLETEQSCYSYQHYFSEGTEKSEVVNKLYQCSICFKTFKSPSKLERHYLMHAGQKPFECLVCGKNFRQAPHLKRHHLTHF